MDFPKGPKMISGFPVKCVLKIVISPGKSVLMVGGFPREKCPKTLSGSPKKKYPKTLYKVVSPQEKCPETVRVCSREECPKMVGGFPSEMSPENSKWFP